MTAFERVRTALLATTRLKAGTTPTAHDDAILALASIQSAVEAALDALPQTGMTTVRRILRGALR